VCPIITLEKLTNNVIISRRPVAVEYSVDPKSKDVIGFRLVTSEDAMRVGIQSFNIGIDGSRFIDQDHRHILLHGINLVCKDQASGYVGPWDQEDLARLRSWGFNVLRLGLIWDGMEPKPGQFDLGYLERIRAFIKDAARYELAIILDMHQDLYGIEFSDGAPSWATITDGATFRPTEPWGEAYLVSTAVQRAFDHFWANDPAADGRGLQDHYQTAWRVAAEALATEPNVVGYDLMNEPFPGTAGRGGWERLLERFARAWMDASGETLTSLAEVLVRWQDPVQKVAMLGLLDDHAIYRSIVEAAEPIFQQCERQQLNPLHQRVAQSLRQVDHTGIIFLESSYFSNMGVMSAITPVMTEAGVPDPIQCYAPHGYDLLTDSEWVHAATAARLEFIFAQHEKTRARLATPMLVGEWGAFRRSPAAFPAGYAVQTLLENLLASDTYWHYLPDLAELDFFRAIQRGYPMAVVGRIHAYRYDPGQCKFSMDWEESMDSRGESILYLPDVVGLDQGTIDFDPAGGTVTVEVIKGSRAGFVHIPAAVSGGMRGITMVSHKSVG